MPYCHNCCKALKQKVAAHQAALPRKCAGNFCLASHL